MQIKRTFLSVFLLVVAAFSAVGQSAFEHPADYNNFVIARMNAVTVSNLTYVSQSVHSDDEALIDAKRQEVIQQIGIAEQQIKGQPPYEKGENLQSESLEVLAMYRQTFALDFKKVLTLKRNSRETYEAMEAYYEAQNEAERKLEKARMRFLKAQERFLKAHELEVPQTEETDFDQQLKDMSAANQYVRKLFLSYFKISKYNMDFFEALEQGENNKLEGYRERLEKAAVETLEELGRLKGFKEDYDLLNQTTDLVRLHRDLTQNELKDLVRVSNLAAEERTQEDVDRYNAAVERYNKEVPLRLDNFNRAQSELMKKYTPKISGEEGQIKRT